MDLCVEAMVSSIILLMCVSWVGRWVGVWSLKTGVVCSLLISGCLLASLVAEGQLQLQTY